MFKNKRRTLKSAGFNKLCNDNESNPNMCMQSRYTELNNISGTINKSFSLIQFNARSLAKNFDSINEMLHINYVYFSVIGLSEMDE